MKNTWKLHAPHREEAGILAPEAWIRLPIRSLHRFDPRYFEDSVVCTETINDALLLKPGVDSLWPTPESLINVNAALVREFF